MLTTLKKFYSRLVSVLTALVMTITTAVFAVASASAADVSDSEYAELANTVAYLINQEREKEGLKPLYCVPYLNECASIRAEETTLFFSHERPNGEYYNEIIDESIIFYKVSAENITAGYFTPEDAVESWKNSPGHWKSAMNPNYTHTGIGVVYDESSEYKWHWVQIFTADWDETKEYEGQYLPTLHKVVPVSFGDINGDESINAFDYIGLVEYIRKKQAGEPIYFNDDQMKFADCFQDGIITEADAACLMRYILGEYKSLPFKFF